MLVGIVGTLRSEPSAGTNIITDCNAIVATVQINIGLFENSPILASVFLSDLHTEENKISINANVTNTAPQATSTPYVFEDKRYIINIATLFIIAGITILSIRNGVNIFSFAFLGFCLIMSFSSFSNPSAIAGIVSVIRLIHNICIGANTTLLNNVATNIIIISARLEANKYAITFCILLYRA